MEHWTNWFKLREPNVSDSGSQTVASTTDAQADLLRDYEPQPEGTFTYTEIGPSIENVDGSIEHSSPRIRTDARAEPHLADNEPFYLERISPEQRRQNALNYAAQAHAARLHFGEDRWVRALGDDTKIPAMAHLMMREGGLLNAAEVALYIGENRQVADELTSMRKNPKEVQEKILELSHQLATGQLGLDKAPYRTYQTRREQQIRGRR